MVLVQLVHIRVVFVLLLLSYSLAHVVLTPNTLVAGVGAPLASGSHQH